MDVHEEPGADQPTLPQQPPGCGDWTARVEAVARVAAQHAADVDAVSRFPDEAIEEARRQGLLGAPVLTADGGLGATHRQLCEAGTAIAMENAHPKLKEIADHIAPPNTEYGVMTVLRQLFDSEES